MEYVVMECTCSYAIVLDGEGRFLKVPNLGYEVGQVVTDVILLDAKPRHKLNPKIISFCASAACLCLIFFGSRYFWFTPAGTVRMQINPDVQMAVNRFDRVIGLVGLNQDGEQLVQDYQSYGHKVEKVSDDLADRALEMGYLTSGGQITFTVRSKHANEAKQAVWETAMEEKLILELELHLDQQEIVIITADTPTQEHIIIIEPEQELPLPIGEDTPDEDDVDNLDDTDDDDRDELLEQDSDDDFDDTDDDDRDELLERDSDDDLDDTDDDDRDELLEQDSDDDFDDTDDDDDRDELLERDSDDDLEDTDDNDDRDELLERDSDDDLDDTDDDDRDELDSDDD